MNIRQLVAKLDRTTPRRPRPCPECGRHPGVQGETLFVVVWNGGPPGLGPAELVEVERFHANKLAVKAAPCPVCGRARGTLYTEEELLRMEWLYEKACAAGDGRSPPPPFVEWRTGREGRVPRGFIDARCVPGLLGRRTDERFGSLGPG